MNNTLLIKTYTEPPFSKKVILQYAGCKNTDAETNALLDYCLKEIKGRLTYRLCYRELPFTSVGNMCNFELFTLQSAQLASNLKGCSSAILFAATIGVELDRLITKYSRLSPSKALMLQAIGTERIEALCDTFCADMGKEKNSKLRPRFSPGYGDLPLSVQRDIFAVLDCERKIGLTLNSSLLMSPSKSVTAFAGIEIKENQT